MASVDVTLFYEANKKVAYKMTEEEKKKVRKRSARRLKKNI